MATSFDADVATTKVDGATERAIEEALSGATRTDCLFAVEVPKGSGLFDFSTEYCRPAERGVILAALGVDINDPLRSRRWALAWRDYRGVLHTAGTSEIAKRHLRSQFDRLVRDI